MMDPKKYQGLTKVHTIKQMREDYPGIFSLSDAKAIVDNWEARGQWFPPVFVSCLHCNGSGRIAR